jgi:hypothetical protein
MQKYLGGKITEKSCPLKETNLLKPGVEQLPKYRVYVINISSQVKVPNISVVQ